MGHPVFWTSPFYNNISSYLVISQIKYLMFVFKEFRQLQWPEAEIPGVTDQLPAGKDQRSPVRQELPGQADQESAVRQVQH